MSRVNEGLQLLGSFDCFFLQCNSHAKHRSTAGNAGDKDKNKTLREGELVFPAQRVFQGRCEINGRPTNQDKTEIRIGLRTAEPMTSEGFQL